MQLPPLKCIPRWFTWGLWAFVCLEDADGSRLCCGLPYPSVPSPGIPTERGSGHGAEAPAWQAGSAHSSAPTAAAWAPKPSIATNRSGSKRGHGGKASAQALPPRAASAKDLTGIRLELHQVSALSPQLQAGMSFTPPDSLFQVGTFNIQRGIATRDQGQQQPWSPFLGPLPILPSPFPSRPLFTLEPFPGVVVCPQETFHTALCGCSWERPPWFPNCFLSTPALSRCEFPPSVLWAAWGCSPFPRSVLNELCRVQVLKKQVPGKLGAVSSEGSMEAWHTPPGNWGAARGWGPHPHPSYCYKGTHGQTSGNGPWGYRANTARLELCAPFCCHGTDGYCTACAFYLISALYKQTFFPPC